MDPLISTIIVSYNTRDLLIKCLDSVFSSRDTGAMEVFVVDNGSGDGSRQAVEKHCPQVHLIKNQSNIGFAAANNIALKKAQGKYIVLLNSDAELRKDGLALMKKFLEETPDAGAVGPRLVYDDGTVQPSADSFPNLMTEFFHLFRLKYLIPGEDTRRRLAPAISKVSGKTVGTYFQTYSDDMTPGIVDCVSGACIMIKRQVLNRVGPLDENFFMYMEDMDWCLRIRQAGYKVYYMREVEVVHHVGMSGMETDRADDRTFVEGYKSRLYYYKKHRGAFARFILRSMTAVAFTLRWPFSRKRRVYARIIKLAVTSS